MRKLLCLAMLVAGVASAEISITQPGGGGGGGSDPVAQAAAAAAQATGNAANTTGATHTTQIAGLAGRSNVWNNSVSNLGANVNGQLISNGAAVSVTLQSALNAGNTGSNATFLGSVSAGAFTDAKGRSKSGISADGRVPYVGGLTWTGRAAVTNQNWNSVCWSPELRTFAAISFSGDSNRFMSSPDGYAWTGATMRPEDNDQIWDVCWSPELRKFVAIASYTIWSSTNGTNWSFKAIPPYYGGYGICWSPERRLFVGVVGDATGSSNKITTSSDGNTWIPRTINSTTHGLSGVCWAPELGLFVAVASSGTGNRAWTSPDGVVWTPRTTPADNDWQRVCWSPELRLLVAVANSGSERIMTSNDGINWTLGSFGNPDQLWSVCWASEIRSFVAVGNLGGIYTSPDGFTWTLRKDTGVQLSSVCWAPELRRFAVLSRIPTAETPVYTSDIEDLVAASGMKSPTGSVIRLNDMSLGYSNSMLYFSLPSSCTGFVFGIGGSNVLMKQNGTLTYVP